MADDTSSGPSDNEKLKEMCVFFGIDHRLQTPTKLLVNIVYAIFTSLRNSHQI